MLYVKQVILQISFEKVDAGGRSKDCQKCFRRYERRYCFHCIVGINFFDTAEAYGNGGESCFHRLLIYRSGASSWKRPQNTRQRS